MAVDWGWEKHSAELEVKQEESEREEEYYGSLIAATSLPFDSWEDAESFYKEQDVFAEMYV